MKKSVLCLIVIILCFTIGCSSNSTGDVNLNLDTVDRIMVLDGRTGESFEIDNAGYVIKIVEIANSLRYEKIIEEAQEPGTSFNITFENKKGSELAKISMGRPQNNVYINNQGYKLVDEDAFLLYAYVADGSYLKKYDEMNEDLVEPEILKLDFDGPPYMVVSLGETEYEISPGTISWKSFEADAGPDYWNGQMDNQEIECQKGDAINFSFTPSATGLAIYSKTSEEEEWSRISLPKTTIVVDGDRLYRVDATWADGKAYYVFKINMKD